MPHISIPCLKETQHTLRKCAFAEWCLLGSGWLWGSTGSTCRSRCKHIDVAEGHCFLVCIEHLETIHQLSPKTSQLDICGMATKLTGPRVPLGAWGSLRTKLQWCPFLRFPLINLPSYSMKRWPKAPTTFYRFTVIYSQISHVNVVLEESCRSPDPIRSLQAEAQRLPSAETTRQGGWRSVVERKIVLGGCW